eukprot:2660450-Amphidinium_carterae.1
MDSLELSQQKRSIIDSYYSNSAEVHTSRTQLATCSRCVQHAQAKHTCQKRSSERIVATCLQTKVRTKQKGETRTNKPRGISGNGPTFKRNSKISFRIRCEIHGIRDTVLKEHQQVGA